MKHFVITRMLCENFRNCSNESLFKEDRLLKMRGLMEKHLVKSLENQTDRDISLIVLVHNDLPEDSLVLFTERNYGIPHSVVRKRDLNSYIYANHTPGEIVVTSRMDGDDNIHKKVVEDVKRAANDTEYVKIIGFGDGAIIAADTNTAFSMPALSYVKSKSGFIAIMETMALNTSNVDTRVNIMDLGNHTTVVKKMPEFTKNKGIEYHGEYACLTPDYVPYLYVRHQDNDSLVTSRSDKGAIMRELKEKYTPIGLNLEQDYAWAL